jgi:hypothetical protein
MNEQEKQDGSPEIVDDAYLISPTSQGRTVFHFFMEGDDAPVCNKQLRDRQKEFSGGMPGQDVKREWQEKEGEIIRRMTLRPCPSCIARINDALELPNADR